MQNPMSWLVGFAILLLAVAGCTQAKSQTPPMYIYTLDPAKTGPTNYDEVAALVSLQGIINREQPLVYINNPGYGRPEYWLDLLRKEERWLEGRKQVKLDSLDDVYELAQSKLKGAVIWDPEVPASFNVATTIAGVEDAVIFSPEFAKRYLKRWNLPVVKDLRGLFTGAETGSRKNDAYRWAIREYLDKGKCSAHQLCLYHDAFYDWKAGQIAYSIVRDWAVMNRAFVFDLSPWGDEVPADDPDQALGTDLATYKLILEATLRQAKGKQMTEMAGFFNFKDRKSVV